MWQTVALLIILSLCIYLYHKHYYNYWKRKNIPYVGSNILDFDWYNLPQLEYYKTIYTRLKGHRFGGCYAKYVPKLMILDPELIKHVLIKDFNYFQDRGDIVFDKNEPLTMHLFNAPGPLWKKLRPKISPAFTSGKIKYMFSLVEKHAIELCNVINKRVEINNSIIDVRDFTSRFTLDVLFSFAFGLEARIIQDDNSIFKAMARKTFVPSLSSRFVLITYSLLPRLKKIFGTILIKNIVTNFFHKFVRDMISCREAEDSNIRNDFLQLLIHMRNDDERLKHEGTEQVREELAMTDDLITAQCFLFFLAGYVTSSITISLALYELAANINVQRKLQREINEYLQKYDDTISYEMLKDMPYLNQVVEETWRKYPLNGVLNRICVHSYKIPNTLVIIEKGTEVLIPVTGLHSDPNYFPNPDQFNPDRFKDPNQYSGSGIYLPFGDGPRSCIASRFARMNVKLALVHLLRNFNFEWCSMTRFPLEFTSFRTVTSVEHEIFLRCSKK